MILSGCIYQQPEVMKVNPVTDSLGSPLEGYTGKSESMFMVLKGSIPEVKEGLYDIVVKRQINHPLFLLMII